MSDFQRGFGFLIEFDSGGKECVSLCFLLVLVGNFLRVWFVFRSEILRRLKNRRCVFQCGLKEEKWFAFQGDIEAGNTNSFFFKRGRKKNMFFLVLSF